jgi:paraquat-inducible protein B
MAERPDLSEDIPEARLASGRWRWSVLIWVVPVVAVIIGAWLALKGVLNHGPTITIVFETASGLEAGKTKVKYKDVDIGLVKSITLSEDRGSVVVTAELKQQAKGLTVEDTKFWVVRPRFAGGQAFGLGTILSGAYIALDPGKSEEQRRDFAGLENPPVITSETRGRQFILRSDDLGSIDVGSPVYYRHARVGQIATAELNKDGKGVSFLVFIDSPYDKYVTKEARFWNASGVDMSYGSGGFRLETESLASILIGGVAFQVPPEMEAGPPAQAGAAFELFKDRETALKQAVTVKDTYVLYFRQSLRGLNVGAPVDFRGVPVGEVSRVMLEYNQERDDLRPAVEISVYPEQIAARLRNPTRIEEPGMRAKTVQRFIERGMRAQLGTGNLVTGQLYVTLDFFPSAPRATMNLAKAPLEIPTISGGFAELQASIENIARTLEKIPFVEVVADVKKMVNTLDTTLHKVDTLVERLDTEIAPELRATLEEVRATLQQAQGMLSEDAPMQGDLRGTLRDVTRAADAIRNLADYLERHPESLLRGKQEEPSR